MEAVAKGVNIVAVVDKSCRVSGAVQTSLFAPFFYYYISRFVKKTSRGRYQAVSTVEDNAVRSPTRITLS
eukprot:SAG11_NODE_6175_length_1371_cov_2.360849_1_plen_70_part_00